MAAGSLWRLVLSGLSGLLYPLCFPDFDFGFLAWIVLVPLHLAIDRLPPRRAFGVAWVGGVIAFIGTMSWVVTAMHLYGKMPLVAAYAVMLLLTAYLGAYVAVYASAFVRLHARRPVVAFLVAPALWVALEWVRTHLLSGLPWSLLGYSQYRWLPAIQIADVTGVYGVSFVVALANAAVAEVFLWQRGRQKAGDTERTGPTFPWLTPSAALVCVAATLIYGYSVLTASPEPAPPRSLTIGLVQPNVDQAQKWDTAFRRETMDRYARMTNTAAAGADLVIWPEAATPFLFEREPDYREEIVRLVQAKAVPLLFGSPTVRFYPDGRPFLLNSAYLLSRSGEVLGRYDKRHLVPFGEYIPLRPILFFLEKLVVGIGDFEAGTGPVLLTLPRTADTAAGPRPLHFGVVICYEVIFPDLVRMFAGAGADLMVTITNDAWFGQSAAPFQHFGMVVLRAVENRVSFARAANTGVSGFIDPYGRILEATPIFEEMVVRGALPVGRMATFYTRHGDVFALGCVIIIGIFTAANWRRRPPARGEGKSPLASSRGDYHAG